VAKYFTQKGYKTEIEHFLSETPVDNKNITSLQSIDIIACKNNEKIAIEIELHDTPHILSNINKCISTGFDTVIIAVYGARLMKQVQRIILSDIESEKWLRNEKLKIKMLTEFL